MRFAKLAVLALTAVSCAGSGAAVTDAPASIVGTEWTLASMDFDGGFLVMSSAGPHPSLLLVREGEAIRASGFAGVNRYSGEAQLGPGTALSFGPLVTTRMAGDPDRMRLERAYLEHLSVAKGYSIVGDKLTLETGNGSLVYQTTQD